MLVDDLKVCVVGLGYVGLPLAVEFAKKIQVIGFDTNDQRIKQLKRGIDITNEIQNSKFIKSKNIKYTYNSIDIKDSNFYIITVPTPITKKNKPDLRFLKSASLSVGKYLKQNDIVVYESTVYPGITEEYCAPLLEKASGLKLNKQFFIGYSPERINPGDKKHTLKNIKKVVSGSNKEVTEIINKLYLKIIKAGTYVASSIKVAEAAKVIENTQRDINIALINELAMIFNKIDLDTHEVLEAAGTKWNFLKFQPGLVGGHCIGVDPYYLTYLSYQIGIDPKVITSGRSINDNMSSYISSQIQKKIKQFKIKTKKPKILIMGFTFKENCPDIRNTKVFDLFKNLSKFASVDVFDPIASSVETKREYKINLTDLPLHHAYDVVVVAVSHKQFKQKGLRMIRHFVKNNYFIYDIKNILKTGERVVKL